MTSKEERDCDINHGANKTTEEEAGGGVIVFTLLPKVLGLNTVWEEEEER